ncbi:tagaturonate reductase [Neobacillus novalis]|uniref:Altronate oxidoreductase n=1 Tax=Neobacillus novalis TaxID=220687 RepID=A0AA95MJK8_9BACI|nr:tagaturonate reductase [Neobacillus novalis]WHY85069.1 tagaturonate reductase [Neobacillus novalis]
MQLLNKKVYKNFKTYPEKVLQFGEGNFLRAFVDWQIQVLNEETDFNGSVVVVQPRGSEKIERLNNQDGLFTLFLQGIKEDQPVKEQLVVDTISRGINLFADYDEYVKLAGQAELRFIVSNTTEAGIVFDPEDRFEDRPQKSFPGKLTAFLYHRFNRFKGDEAKGCIIIPCELIENNGGMLKEVVLQYAEHWNLGEAFISWLENANTFCSSLVDRIVPGYPKDSSEEIQKELGYEDQLMVVGEQYYLWAIEGPDWLGEELPFAAAGLKGTFIVNDLTKFRTRKVRILNGAHTAMTPVAYLSGLDTVEESVNHSLTGKFINDLIYEEIIPTLDDPQDELMVYTNEVLNRFKNPYIKHYLMSISLNSISKFKTRDLPILVEYVNRFGALPERLVFSFSSLLYFYKGKRGGEEIKLDDHPKVLTLFASLWEKYQRQQLGLKELAAQVLADTVLWGEDLTDIPGLTDMVAAHLDRIETDGITAVIKDLSTASVARGEG